MFHAIDRKIKRHLRRYRFLSDRSDRKHIQNAPRESADLAWRVGPRSPVRRVEAGSTQIGHQLFLFGGYVTLGSVSQRVDVLDLQRQQWSRTSTLPSNIPQTHAGMTNDGQRYIYSVSGQLGAHCSPGVKNCFSFDSQTHQWRSLPDLPEIRYMPLVHLFEDRLHCFGGTQADRCSPSSDHWSLQVLDGEAREAKWTREPSLPQPRNHTASKLFENQLFVFGGQQTDVPRLEGSSEFICNFDTAPDQVFDEVFAFDLKTHQHSTLQPMPVPLSHCENTVFQIGDQVVLCGGTRSRQKLSDIILAYDLKKNLWRKIGSLPYPMKSKAAAWYEGKLFVVNGQRSANALDLRPDEVLDSVWIADFNLQQANSNAK